MKTLRLNFLVVMVMALLTMAGCKKSEDKPSSDYVKPSQGSSATIVNVPTSLQNSTDPNAAMISTYAQMVNGFGGMTTMLANLPANATESDLKSSGRSWTWTDNQGNSVWVEFAKDDIQYTWNLYFQTADMSARKLVVTATELQTGLAGTMKIYNYLETTSTAVVNYEWAKATDGTVTANVLFNGVTESVFFILVSKTDGSGSYAAYLGTSASDVKFLEATWNASGHGTWWVKDINSSNTYSGTY